MKFKDKYTSKIQVKKSLDEITLKDFIQCSLYNNYLPMLAEKPKFVLKQYLMPYLKEAYDNIVILYNIKMVGDEKKFDKEKELVMLNAKLTILTAAILSGEVTEMVKKICNKFAIRGKNWATIEKNLQVAIGKTERQIEIVGNDIDNDKLSNPNEDMVIDEDYYTSILAAICSHYHITYTTDTMPLSLYCDYIQLLKKESKELEKTKQSLQKK